MINPNQPAFGASYNGVNMVSAPAFFTDASVTFATWAAGASAYVTGLQPIITGGGGSVLLANGTSVGLTQAQITQIQQLMAAAGQNTTQIAGATISYSQGVLGAAAPVFSATSGVMAQNAAATADKEVDAIQTGSSIVPIIGFSFKPMDNLVVGFKYEHRGSMTLTNKTEKDDTGMFPDEAETPSDMPSMFSLGVSFGATSNLRLSATAHYYLDKNANYGKKLAGAFVSNSEVIDSNLWEAAFGVEYLVSRNFLVSAGYLRTQTGVKDLYQNDLSHSLSTNSIGAGLRYGIMDNIGLNLGVMNTWYTENVRAFSTFNETYNRKAFVLAVGVDVSF
jgi:opacity protein-like surface antigen